MPRGVRIADVITWMRIALLPIIWSLALLGQGYLVGLGLVLAGITDVLDGYAARRLGQATAAGARLDTIADILLLISATAWIGLLHPEIVTENAPLLAGTLLLYVASLAAGLIKFRRIGTLHLYSSRVAGGLLYLFAVVTLLGGGYDRRLLVIAAAALMVSSAETLVANLLLGVVDERVGSVLLRITKRAETRTIHAMGSARKARSQAPTSKVVGRSASPISSNPTAAAPSPNDSGP
jgi:phosphatidylglycerophosphate synthase